MHTRTPFNSNFPGKPGLAGFPFGKQGALKQKVFTGWTPFLSLNQQCQSIERQNFISE